MCGFLIDLPADIQEEVMRKLGAMDMVAWGLACKKNLAFLSPAIAITKRRLLTFNDSDEKLNGNNLAGHMVRSMVDERRRSVLAYAAVDLGQLHVNATTIDVSKALWTNVPLATASNDGRNYQIHIDSDSNIDVASVIAHVTMLNPEHVLITCDSEYDNVLQDEHVILLSRVPSIALLGHKGLTDLGLAHIATAKVLWLGGCTGIMGQELPKLVYEKHALYSIKWKGGWGHPYKHPFDDTCVKWLHQQALQNTVVAQW